MTPERARGWKPRIPIDLSFVAATDVQDGPVQYDSRHFIPNALSSIRSSNWRSRLPANLVTPLGINTVSRQFHYISRAKAPSLFRIPIVASLLIFDTPDSTMDQEKQSFARRMKGNDPSPQHLTRMT